MFREQPSNNRNKMARHTSECIKLIEQAQISFGAKELDRHQHHSETLIAVSNKHACVLVLSDNKCQVCSVSKLEGIFKGSEEQSIDESCVLSEKAFSSPVLHVSLSTDAEFVAIHTLKEVQIFHISAFCAQV